MESSVAPPTLAAAAPPLAAQLPAAPPPMAAPGSLASLQRPAPLLAAPPPASAIQTANAQLNAQLAAARAAANGYAQPPRALPAYAPTRPPGASSYGRVPLPEATKLQIRLETPNGVRTGQDLVVDKRQVVLHLAAKDDRDGHARLPVVISLVFEDQSALPAHAAPSAITGKTVNAVEGAANIKLSIKAMSSAHERRRFRIRVGPQDASLAAELPDLIQHTEPFSMVHTTAKMLGATPSSRGAGGAGAGAGPSSAAARSPNGFALGGPRPPIGKLPGPPPNVLGPGERHRYFPADSVRAATAAPAAQEGGGVGGGLPLSRGAVGVCDRLAVLVTHQLTRRAWHHARRRATGAAAGDGSAAAAAPAPAPASPAKGGRATREIVADDVLAVATRPGQYDFLHVSGALGKWLPTGAPTLDPAAPFFPDGVAPPAAPPTAPMNTGLNAPAAPPAAPMAAAAAAPNGACAPAAPPEMAQPPTE